MQTNFIIDDMKKRITLALAATLASASMMAGGLLTNTNQNASFLRQMSQDGIIDVTGQKRELSLPPRGVAFKVLRNSWGSFKTDGCRD